MLESIDVGRQFIGDLEATAGRETVQLPRVLAGSLAGARARHLNAVPYRGGAGEPPMRLVGLNHGSSLQYWLPGQPTGSSGLVKRLTWGVLDAEATYQSSGHRPVLGRRDA